MGARRASAFAIVLLLAGCGDGSSGNASQSAAAPIAAPEPARALAPCTMPKLDFRGAAILDSADQRTFAELFRSAFDRACSEGLFKDKPLIAPDAYVKDTLFIADNQMANVTSIYFAPHGAPPVMMLESAFGSPPRLPPVEELHEAIYCAQVGATEEEQESSGRCLPD